MIYSDIDIESTDNGDLVLQNGDFKKSTSARSILQAISFLILTDYGDYVPNTLFGANLGSFIGKNNSASARTKMQSSIALGVDLQELILPSDITISVVPLEVDEALVILRMPLNIEEPDPDDEITEPLVLGFRFPYIDGELTKITLPSES